MLGSAERLPLTPGAIDAVTCSSGIHWFDQERFYGELRRVVRTGGWIGLYDHYFLGMQGVEDFQAWVGELFARYPLPPRNPQVGDPRAETPRGFELVGTDLFEDPIEMTRERVRRLPALGQPLRCRGRARNAPPGDPRLAARIDRTALRKLVDAGAAVHRHDHVPTAPRRRAGHVTGGATVSRSQCAESRFDRTRRPRQLRPAETFAGERAQLVDRRRAAAGARHDVGHDELAPFVVGYARPRRRRATSGWWASTPSTSVGLTLTPPVMTRSFRRSTTRTRPSVVDRTDVAGVEPTVVVEHRRGTRGVEPVFAHDHRPAHEDLVVVVTDPHLGARDRNAVERETAPGLREPVRVDDARRPAPRRAPAAPGDTARRH